MRFERHQGLLPELIHAVDAKVGILDLKKVCADVGLLHRLNPAKLGATASGMDLYKNCF